MAIQFKGFRATRPVSRLSDKTKNVWEAFFILYDGPGRKVFRYKDGINKLPPSQRKAEAEEVARALWQALNEGWDPRQFRYPRFTDHAAAATPLFADALQAALAAKCRTLSKYSRYDYQGAVRFFTAAAVRLGYGQTRCDKIERKDIRAIVENAREKQNWSPGARNKYLTILKSLLSVMRDDLEVIKFNPAAGLKNEPTGETVGFKRLTAEEKKRIVANLSSIDPAFLEYLTAIYDDGIRRKEALLIRIRDLDRTRREIHITSEVSKTNKARIVPITDTLLEILDRRGVWNLPRDWFVFSRDNYRPGPEPYHPNSPTTRWRNLVQKELGIDCKMYSLKHTGADDKLAAGIPLDALRGLYGHRSIQMTEIYARSVRSQYSQQIIDKAPVLGK